MIIQNLDDNLKLVKIRAWSKYLSFDIIKYDIKLKSLTKLNKITLIFIFNDFYISYNTHCRILNAFITKGYFEANVTPLDFLIEKINKKNKMLIKSK